MLYAFMFLVGCAFYILIEKFNEREKGIQAQIKKLELELHLEKQRNWELRSQLQWEQDFSFFDEEE